MTTNYSFGDHFYYKMIFPLINFVAPASLDAISRNNKNLYDSATQVVAAAGRYFARADQIVKTYRATELEISGMELNLAVREQSINHKVGKTHSRRDRTTPRLQVQD